MYNPHPNIPPLCLAFVAIMAITPTGPYHDENVCNCHIIQDAWIAQTTRV